MLKVYGYSDDTVEIEGQMNDSISIFDATLRIHFIDGTIVDIRYGKDDKAIWDITLVAVGELFERLDLCDDEDADVYSDILYMKDSQKCIIEKFEER